jgi:hypothetical protein
MTTDGKRYSFNNAFLVSGKNMAEALQIYCTIHGFANQGMDEFTIVQKIATPKHVFDKEVFGISQSWVWGYRHRSKGDSRIAISDWLFRHKDNTPPDTGGLDGGHYAGTARSNDQHVSFSHFHIIPRLKSISSVATFAPISNQIF